MTTPTPKDLSKGVVPFVDRSGSPAAMEPGGDRPAIPVSGQSSSNSVRIEGLVRAQFDFVWRTARRLGLPDAAADDAAQQTFIVASRRIDDIEAGKERAFLYRTLTNVMAEQRRAYARKREDLSDQEYVAGLADPRPNPEQSMADAQARELLDRVLAGLDDDARQVFVLFELEGMTVPEIASALEIPGGTAASRLRRAREQFDKSAKRLRAALEGGRS